MTSVDTSPFVEAERREHELNRRQREILDLLVKGKTNSEIAESLDMTLDGAKWNVSEILTKLGLGTREEAAEYWRWRQSRGRRFSGWMRALATPLVGKVATAVGGAALAGGAVFALVVANQQAPLTEAEPAPVLQPFYLEAVTTINQPYDETSTARTELRWWYQDIDHQRVEVDEYDASGSFVEGSVMVADGVDASVAHWGPGWQRAGFTDGYSSFPLEAVPEGLAYRPWTFPRQVGPQPVSPGGMSELVSMLSLGTYETEHVGEDELLGRKVELIRRWYTDPGRATGDSTTYAIDPETLFVLRAVSSSEPGGVAGSVEVVQLELGVEHEADVFAFNPPAGLESATGGVAFGLGRHLVHKWHVGSADARVIPQGMPALDLTGLQLTLALASVSQDPDYLRTFAQYEHPRGRLSIEQVIEPGSDASNYHEAIANGPGIDQQGGGLVLAWSDGGVRFAVRSEDLTAEEIVAVAEKLPRP